MTQTKKLMNYLAAGLFLLAGQTAMAQVWKNPNAPVEDRVQDLLSKMTLEEKISQCSSDIPAIERLGIPGYVWYGEALHGIIAWNCTSFPQNIAMGSTWNPDMMFDVATAISNEARALKNAGKKEVMMFSPTVNMSRDPRWGRNEECFSEDPFLMSEIARMYVRGMQGNDSKYLKTVCTVKHYIANNVDQGRERIQSNISEEDLREYYMPAYKICVADEEAAGIMTALNGLNGKPCSGDKWLIKDVLRGEWGFEGYVIADWNAACGMYHNQKFVNSYEEASAAAIKATCDQECFRPKASKMVQYMKPAIEKGLITEKELDASVARLLRLRFMTGDFDKPALSPWKDINRNVLECDAHKQLALKAAEEAIVLLKNENNILPLKKDVKSIAVSGPFANRCWLGIYSGYPKSKVTILDGIRQATNAEINFVEGCGVTDKIDEAKIQAAVEAAKKSEVAIVVVGNDETTATENNDRETLALPGAQQQLVEAVTKANKNTIVVLVPSGATTLGAIEKKIPGVICAWPNGQEQGKALANVLWGKYNPGGKTTSTWYKSDSDLPDMHDYNIKEGRTYMYFDGKPLYAFGHGLSYTTFNISKLKLDKKNLKKGQSIKVSVQVKNTGKMDGDEVVQLYIRDIKSTEKAPKMALKGFKRIHVKQGATQTVELEVPYEAFGHFNATTKKFEVEAGKFEIMVGNASDNISVKRSIKVAGGLLPPVNVKNKSAWFNAKDPKRAKKWDDIYSDKSFLTKKAQGAKKDNGLAFRVWFKDPGFYVNHWNAEVNYLVKSKEASFKLTMLGNEIDTYKVVKGQGQKGSIPVKIPIPPEYGKETVLKAHVLKGKLTIKSIKINPPGGKASYTVYP